jgi:TRIAD3 protein (E3 ubiquitin-protein ligase RNF216)
MNAGQDERQVIDLLSDGEDYVFGYDGELGYFDDGGYGVDVVPPFEQGVFEVEEAWERDYGGFGLEGAAQPGPLELQEPDHLDFTRPNGNVQPEPALVPNNPRPVHPAPNNPMDAEADIAEGEVVTTAACLQMVVDILPDISVDHVLALIADQTQDNTRTSEACHRIISQLLDSEAYPKEEEKAGRKRKRERSLSEFEDDNGDGRPGSYKNDA